MIYRSEINGLLEESENSKVLSSKICMSMYACVCVYAHWNQIDYANERKTMLLSGKCSQTNMFEIQI